MTRRLRILSGNAWQFQSKKKSHVGDGNEPSEGGRVGPVQRTNLDAGQTGLLVFPIFVVWLINSPLALLGLRI